MFGTSELISKFKKLESKNFRHAYMNDHIRIGIATQIKLMRIKAGMTQADLANAIGSKQAVISRLEDPDGGSVNLSTLLKIAKAFDVSLISKFVPFSKFLDESKKITPTELAATNFTEEYTNIQADSMKSVFDFIKQFDVKPAAKIGYQKIDDMTCFVDDITNPMYEPYRKVQHTNRGWRL